MEVAIEQGLGLREDRNILVTHVLRPSAPFSIADGLQSKIVPDGQALKFPLLIPNGGLWNLRGCGPATGESMGQVERTAACVNKLARLMIQNKECGQALSSRGQDARQFCEIVAHVGRTHMGKYRGQESEVEMGIAVREPVLRGRN